MSHISKVYCSSTCGSVKDLGINIHIRPKFSHFELSSSFCNLNNMGKICKIWKNKPILHMKLKREWCVLELFVTLCYFLKWFETIWTFWNERFGTNVLELFVMYFMLLFETIWNDLNVLERFGIFCYSMLLYEMNLNDLNVLERTFWNVFGMFWNFLLLYVTFWNDLKWFDSKMFHHRRHRHNI